MPRQLVAPAYGGPDPSRLPDRLDLIEVPPATAGDGQVVIAVRAAGVNPSDAKGMAGVWGRDEAKLPLRPGNEVSGVVTAVGDDVDGVAVGDEVLAFRVTGGFADEVVAKVADVFAKPSSLGWEAAAGLLLTGGTAWHLVEGTAIAPGDRVIVHGASGAVGSLAVQLAVARGATVVGTASARSADRVRADGATPVEYGAGLEARLRELLPDGADVALDAVGTDEAVDVSVALVADRDRIATINAFERGAELGIRRFGGGPGADPGSALRRAARPELVRLAGEGALRVHLGPSFPLTDARAALELVTGGHPGGKVTIAP